MEQRLVASAYSNLIDVVYLFSSRALKTIAAFYLLQNLTAHIMHEARTHLKEGSIYSSPTLRITKLQTIQPKNNTEIIHEIFGYSQQRLNISS